MKENSARENNPGVSTSFLDKYSDYINIHLLSIFLENFEVNEENIDNIMEILSTNATLSKRLFTKSTNLELFSRKDIVQTFTLLLKRAKESLSKFIFSDEIFMREKGDTDFSFNIRKYNTLQKMIGDLPYHQELVYKLTFELVDELLIPHKDNKNISNINDYSFVQESYYTTDTFEKAYKIIYNYQRKKKKECRMPDILL